MPYFKMLTHEMTMASDIEIPSNLEITSDKEDNQVRDLWQMDICSAGVTGHMDEERSLYG